MRSSLSPLRSHPRTLQSPVIFERDISVIAYIYNIIVLTLEISDEDVRSRTSALGGWGNLGLPSDALAFLDVWCEFGAIYTPASY